MSKKDEELDELRYNLDIILDELRPNLAVFRNTLDELKKNLSENMVKDKSNLLQETIKKLKIELIDKQNEIKELQKVNQTNNKPVQPVKGNYLRGSNLI
jgi:predicted RNase H-like nuclease (RuvC/YqgF family)